MRTEGVATRELPKLSFDEAMKPFDDGRGLQSDRIETLRVSCDTLQVLIVKAVRVEHEAHSVRRQIWHDGTPADF